MTHEQLRADVESAGWRITKNRDLGGNQCNWYAWLPKRPDSWPDCECNDKPPAMSMHPFAYTINGVTHASVEFSICGEMGGRWFDLKLYSVPMAEAMDAIPQAIASLGAAWEAIAALKQQP